MTKGDKNEMIAILGCGPAGLLVAHACAQHNQPFWIFSFKHKSPIGGAQYLHRAIPGLTHEDPESYVRFTFQGTRDKYAEKVYGDVHAPVSWDMYHPGYHPAWNMRSAYHRLWDLYSHFIMNMQVDYLLVSRLVDDFKSVFSSVPYHAITHPRSQDIFENQAVWITDGAACPGNTVIYNGEDEKTWYRQSNIFGTEYTEWPMDPSSAMVNAHKIRKPLRTNCEQWPEVHKFGRYGQWKKGVLIHHAYEEAGKVLDEM